MISRRSLIGGATVAALCFPARAQPQQTVKPLIIRPEIEGVDPRYAAYATVGKFHIPQSPIILRTPRSRIVAFRPLGVDEAPIIVFSHGALSDPLTYRSMLEHWVSHGFAVIAPIHDDAAIESGLSLRSSNPRGVSEWRIDNLLRDEKAWRTRTDDCSGCLDALSLLGEALKIRLSADRPIIVGHGYGAFVAQLLLGATVKGENGTRLRFKDTRFFSGILMSPQGAGIMGLDETSWSDLDMPLMTMVAQGDRDFGGQDAERKADVYRLSPAGYKHLARFKNGSQTTFAGQRASVDKVETKLTEIIRAMTAAFALSYGKYEEVAFKDVSSGFFQRMSLGLVEESRR